MRACARGLESAGMRPESLTIAFALATALLAGCGQFKLPEALTPPEFAPVGQRAPEFNVLAEDPGRPGWFREVRSESFEGSILVAMGAQPGFVGELLPWLEVLEAKYGRPRIAGSGESDAGRYTVILIVERGSFNLADRAQEPTLAMLRSLMPSGLTLHLDPRRDFVDSKETEKSRFGFVGEGPHIAVVSADGTLLALIEGPVSERRAARLVEAMDRAFSLGGPRGDGAARSSDAAERRAGREGRGIVAPRPFALRPGWDLREACARGGRGPVGLAPP